MPLDIPGQRDPSAPSSAWGVQLKGPAGDSACSPLTSCPQTAVYRQGGGGSPLLIPYGTCGDYMTVMGQLCSLSPVESSEG